MWQNLSNTVNTEDDVQLPTGLRERKGITAAEAALEPHASKEVQAGDEVRGGQG